MELKLFSLFIKSWVDLPHLFTINLLYFLYYYNVISLMLPVCDTNFSAINLINLSIILFFTYHSIVR